MRIKVILVVAFAVLLAACSSSGPATLSPTEGIVLQNVAALAAARSTTVADLVGKGQGFCRLIAPWAGLEPVVAALLVNGEAYSVLNKGAADVAGACALVNGVPVPAPADPAAAPIVAAVK